MTVGGPGRVKTRSDLVVIRAEPGFLRLFVPRDPTRLKNRGALLPRRVFTQPGAINGHANLLLNCSSRAGQSPEPLKRLHSKLQGKLLGGKFSSERSSLPCIQRAEVSRPLLFRLHAQRRESDVW